MASQETDAGFSTFAFVWGKYRSYAGKSREQKASLETWRNIVLLLALAGASLGALSQHALNWNPSWLTGVLGGLAAGGIALSSYFNKEFIKPEKERTWVRARAAAEAFKSQAYLFATRTRPYDSPEAVKRLSEKADMLEKKVADLPTKPLSKEEKAKDIPSTPMSVEDYVRERVNEQINTFYVPSAKKYDTYSRRWNVGRWFLGAIAAILGVVAGAAPSSLTGLWIGVVGVMTSAVAAHTAAGRYSYLTLSYQSTGDQLEKLVSAWRDKIIDDQELVQECEATISVENQAWMAQGIRTARPV